MISTSDGQYLYITDRKNARLIRLNLWDLSQSQTIIASQPSRLALSPDESKIYVAQSGATTIAVVDTANFATQIWDLNGNVPSDIEATDDRVYIAANSSSSTALVILNATTGAIINVHEQDWHSSTGLIEIDPIRKKLYAGAVGSPIELSRWDITTDNPIRETRSTSLGANGRNLTLSPDGIHLLYMVGGGNGAGYTVYNLQALSNQFLYRDGEYGIGTYPLDMVYHPDGSRAYGICSDPYDTDVKILNTATQAQTGILYPQYVDYGEDPLKLSLSGDGGNLALYAEDTYNDDDGHLYLFSFTPPPPTATVTRTPTWNPSTPTITPTMVPTHRIVDLGGRSKGMVATADGQYLYVSDWANDRVVRFDLWDLSQVQVSIGGEPTRLALSPAESKLYVVQSAATSLAVVDTSTLDVNIWDLSGNVPVDVRATEDRLYIMANERQSNAALLIVNASSGALIKVHQQDWDNGIGMIELDRTRKKLYAGVRGISPSNLFRWDVSTDNPVRETQCDHSALGSNGRNLTLSPDNIHLLFMVGSGNRGYVVFNLRALSDKFRSRDGEYDIGTYPLDMVYHPDGSRAYGICGDPYDKDVKILNTATQVRIGTLNPQYVGYGEDPLKLCMSGDGGNLALYTEDSQDNGRLYIFTLQQSGPTPTPTPQLVQKLAVVKKNASGDVNLYYYNSLVRGDWNWSQAYFRNHTPYCRDLWKVPAGNDAIDITAIRGTSTPLLYALRKREPGNLDLYLYSGLAKDDWTFSDALARNGWPRARDLWIIPGGDDAVGIEAVDISSPQDGTEELAILKKQHVSDLNLYYYKMLVTSDWSYWDAASRNPSPVARDLWIIPRGNNAIDFTSVSSGGGVNNLMVVKRDGINDLNVYMYNNPVEGDWTYWDAIARNPSPLARDLWVLPAGNNIRGLTAIDADGDGTDELAIFKEQGPDDINIYYYNALVPGDWTYWDCIARNPSPLARDLWFVPDADDILGVTAAWTK